MDGEPLTKVLSRRFNCLSALTNDNYNCGFAHKETMIYLCPVTRSYLLMDAKD
jgi:hypothetical protein